MRAVRGVVFSLVLLVAVFVAKGYSAQIDPEIVSPALRDGFTLAFSVLIESIPFIILGIALSVLVQVWLPEEWLFRILPSRPVPRRFAISMDSLEEERILPAQLSGRDVFEGQTLVLSDGRRIQTVAIGNQQGTDFTSLIFIGDESGLTPLYRTPDDRGSIGTFVPSPSDQYLAIETIPNRASRQSDERLLEPRDISSTIVVVDVDSGQVVRSVEGVLPVWIR